MKNNIIFVLTIISLIALSSLILAGCMYSIADDNGETRPYDITGSVSSMTRDISVITESNTPTPQETMQKKFLSMSSVDEKNKSITVITPEYLKEYWADGKIHSLTSDELLFVIQDSIRICEQYDEVILPAFTDITTDAGETFTPYSSSYVYSPYYGNTDKVVGTKYTSLEELKTVGEYDDFENAVAAVIMYRMSALSSPGAFIFNSEAISYYGGNPVRFNSLYPEGCHYISGYSESTDREGYFKYFSGGSYKEEIDMKELINSGIFNMTCRGGMLGTLSKIERDDSDPLSSIFVSYKLRMIFPTEEMTARIESIRDKAKTSIEWRIDGDSTLVIYGKGAMDNYHSGGDGSGTPWNDLKNGITDIVIEKGVTSIGDYSFCGLNYVRTVTVSDTVTGIGEYAFDSCRSLVSVTLPDGLKKIGKSAFAECRLLEKINIPDSVISIGKYAFFCCESITEITVPKKVTSIEDGVFEQCCSLRSVTLPGGLKYIGDAAFDLCCALDGLDIPSGVDHIGRSAFYGCTALNNIKLPAGIKDIGYETFGYCTRFTGITLPEGVVSIGEYAFESCGLLKEVAIPSGTEKIDKNAFTCCFALESVTIPDSVTFIGEKAFFGCKKLVIYCNAGSFAEQYAREYGIKVKLK